jgi:hypothetical protein
MAEVQALDLTTIEKPPQHRLRTLRFFPKPSCGRPVEADSVLPTAEFQVPGRTNAVTIRFIHVFFMQVFGSKDSKEIERETEKIMVARIFVILSRLLLVGAALSGGISLVGAQTTKSPQTPAQTAVQEPAQSPSANLKPVPGKMRGMTNDMRRAAAVRNADRQAQAKKHAPTSKGEVK